MDIRPIKTEEDYERALSRVEALFDAEPDTHAGDELDVLVTLIEAWEDRNLAIDAPDPVDAIRFRMDQLGLQPKDLEPYIGGRGRVSEILNGKRSLSLRMIRNLHEGLGLPYESLIPA